MTKLSVEVNHFLVEVGQYFVFFFELRALCAISWLFRKKRSDG